MPEINLLCIRQKKAIRKSFGGLRLVRCNKRRSEKKGMQTISSAWARCMETCIGFTPKRTTKSVILSAAHMTL